MLSSLDSWKKLKEHFGETRNAQIKGMFEDPGRTKKFSLDVGGIYFDYSKNRINSETLGLFSELLSEVGLGDRINALFSGDEVNYTEGRPALHTALRNGATPEVRTTLERMGKMSEDFRSGNFKNFVNIGIGGSDLGPAMAYESLISYSDRDLVFRFVSNVDPGDFYEKTRDLNPEETLFLVASKSFTTNETLANANAARAWIVEKLGDQAIEQHFLAMSANLEKVSEFGISSENTLPLWDWVGGRYSIWGSIGMSLMIAIGKENFIEFLAGGKSIDEHFQNAEYHANIPVLMACLSIWYNNFFGSETYGIMPYSNYLRSFPRYIQQVVMESNGKSVVREGVRVNWNTSPIVWGEVGTNAQHSFFQLLHQGTRLVPVDFICFSEPIYDNGDQHAQLLANCFAQSKALAFGFESDDPNKFFEGNRPSNTLLFEKLTPYTLGQLIALYEHKTFVEGVIWGINSFDQFGVELGKSLAKDILPAVKGGEGSFDSSTNELIGKIKN